MGGRAGVAAAIASAIALIGPVTAAGHHPLAIADAGPQPVLAASGAGAQASAITGCSGEPMPDPERVISGAFGAELEGSYVLLPLDVPARIDAIRIRYCHDQPALATVPGTTTLNKHTLDIGVYEPRGARDPLWDQEEFRGWGGSSRRDVTLSPEGSYDPDPAPVASDKTTVGFRPGPIAGGEWAVELGVAALGEEGPSEDGAVQWRVEVDLIDDPAFADEPWEPAAYDRRPARSAPGWYAGDMHVHARHSAPGDATMRETFSYAFCPDPALGSLCEAEAAQPGAVLDFITLSDYNTDRAWHEIGAFQRDYPGKLIVRSSEVITYRGHVNNHASGTFVDYRTAPIYERRPNGSLERIRGPRPASAILRRVQAAGGWTQINHPETFPSEIPTFGNLCRGCSWEYDPAQTDYSRVDAIEIATGPAGLQQDPSPGPNPFTPLAIRFYEQAIDAGGLNSNRIAAVGSSDSHNAGRPDDPLTQSPIGQATTVVRAEELSERGIGSAVRAGHTYVKLWGNDGPDLRLEATTLRGGRPAIFGDTLHASHATFTARVLGLDRARDARPGDYVLFVLRNGEPMDTVPIGAEDELRYEFEADTPGRYGLQVQRTGAGAASVEAFATPIWLEPRARGGDNSGRSCGNRVVGSRGDDRLRGTAGSDRLIGRRGDDRLRPRGGRDCVRAGVGDDRVRALDGEADLVRCGRGRDLARSDPRDRLRGCERRD